MTNMTAPILVALSSDFLKAYAKIPRDKQTGVRNFIEKFKENPTSPGLNYEKVKGAVDPQVRSVRIDQQYRAIVLQPEQGNIYMLLWVDNHDKAYQWAKNKSFPINPETGAIQVIDIEEQEPEAVPEPAAEGEGLFDSLRDRELRRLGVPDSAIPMVRAIRMEADLEAIADRLPQEAYEGLFMICAGYSYEEAERETTPAPSPEAIDTGDFAKALENPNTKRRFVVIEDDYELEAMLEAPLAQWRVFLHPTQRKIVQMQANGPIRVLGGAGTGKTVVAMHRAKWLAENVFTRKDQHILFTTFTKNLAIDIAENLKTICSRSAMQRIEVINIDAWVNRFLISSGYKYSPKFGKQLNSVWAEALNLAPPELELDDQFYRDEWEFVIQAQGITTRDEYLKASRVGRGQRLSRKDRALAWPVFEEYRAELQARKWKELTDAVRDARYILESSGPVLPYYSVVVDEAQDMGPEVFKLIRQIVPPERAGEGNDIFITGDAHQRIYRNKVVLSHCGIDIVGRSRRLRVNYRTTEETRKWAVRLLEGRVIDDLDGAEDSSLGYTSLMHGPDPEIVCAPDFQTECRDLTEYVKRLLEEGAAEGSICIVARTRDLVAQYEGAMKVEGIRTYPIKSDSSDKRDTPGVRMATMHRVKGLEFDYVLIAGVNDGIVPLDAAMTNNSPFEREESETRERALLYVAATRAKKSLRISAHGTPSPFLGTGG
jgi:mRNA-degrading endonuclease RelE of RelBE toxin-antitoxin system